MQYALIFLISLIVTIAVTPLVIRLAVRFNCLDRPGLRKFHKRSTPLWGGLAFIVGFMPAFFFLNMDREVISYMIGAFLLLIIGGIDDRWPLGWKVKWLGLIAATSVSVFYGGIAIEHVGTFGDPGDKLWLGFFGIPFTFFCVLGVTNALNLIDGLNGLAGGISIIALLFLGFAAHITGDQNPLLMSLSLAGALAGFLRYNFPKAKIFMGDSGSLFLGYSLSVFSIMLTQHQNAVVEPMLPVLVLLVPIFDTLRVMILRILKGRNPFVADKTHIHHLMNRKGFSKRRTVITLWSLTFACGAGAMLLVGKTFTLYLIVALSASLLLALFMESLTKRERTRSVRLRLVNVEAERERKAVRK